MFFLVYLKLNNLYIEQNIYFNFYAQYKECRKKLSIVVDNKIYSNFAP